MLSIFGARTSAARIERTIGQIVKHGQAGTLVKLLEALEKTKSDFVDCFEAQLNFRQRRSGADSEDSESDPSEVSIPGAEFSGDREAFRAGF